jgi:hypothetical protein
MSMSIIAQCLLGPNMLDAITCSADLRACHAADLRQIADEKSRCSRWGACLAECSKAAMGLAKCGLSITVADAQFAKALGADLIVALARARDLDYSGGGIDRRL